MRCTVTEGCPNTAEMGSLGCYVCGPAPKPQPPADVTVRGCVSPGCTNAALKGRQYCSNACMWKKNKHEQAMRAKSPALQKPPAPAVTADPPPVQPQKSWADRLEFSKAPELPPATQKLVEDFRASHPPYLCIDEPEMKQLRPSMEFLARCAGAMEDMPGVKRVGLMVWVDEGGNVTMEPPVFSKVDH